MANSRLMRTTQRWVVLFSGYIPKGEGTVVRCDIAFVRRRRRLNVSVSKTSARARVGTQQPPRDRARAGATQYGAAR